MPVKSRVKASQKHTVFPKNIRSLFLIFILFVGFIIGSFGLWQWFARGGVKVYQGSNLSFLYSRAFRERPLIIGQDKNVEGQVKLAAENPLALIELNKEKGAIIGANVTRIPLLNLLEKNSEKVLPIRYQNFKKTGSERLKVANQEISLIRFNYTAANKKTTVFSSVFLIPHDNNAYYLTVQSTNEATANKSTELIRNSLRVY